MIRVTRAAVESFGLGWRRKFEHAVVTEHGWADMRTAEAGFAPAMRPGS